MRTFILFLLVLGSMLHKATPARAQVCGDADGNGTVSVSDGVQVLRAAVGLSSTCTPAACDVDGNGEVTVSDGVNVLRKAAGLAITESCGGVNGQVQTVLRELQPLLNLGLGFATGKPVASCTNAPDGELQEDFDPQDGTTTSFYSCQVGNIELDGDVTVGATMLSFFLLEASTAGAEDFIADYDGDLTMGVVAQGKSLSGGLDITSASATDFTLTFDRTTIVGTTLTGGTAVLDLAGSDLEDSLSTIELTFDGSGIVRVLVTLRDGSSQSLRFDLAQGVLSS